MMDHVKERGLVLLGCGKMGSAMLAGWLKSGVPPDSVWAIDPKPSDWLKAQGTHLNVAAPGSPAVVVVAVKPQIMAEALPGAASMGGGATLFLTVAAGIPLVRYTQMLGAGTPVVRAMPNTPAAIGRGMTVLAANEDATAQHLDLAEALMQSVGQTLRLASEDQMDAATIVSGCGPAYVFHLIEAMAAAGEAEGLPADLAMTLAKATVGGAGLLAEQADEEPGQLRVNVTSPGGVTAAALEVLMAPETGFAALMRQAARQAVIRSEELGRG